MDTIYFMEKLFQNDTKFHRKRSEAATIHLANLESPQYYSHIANNKMLPDAVRVSKQL